MEISVNRERILREFSELVSVDCESFNERKIADILTEKLEALGFEIIEDKAGEVNGGNAGNIYGILHGNIKGGSLLFSAHMDTVSPGKGKRAVFHRDGKITSEGNTVLGADDAAGLAEIIEGIRSVKESGKPHRDIEILFSIGEEAYLKGTECFDFSIIKSREAYVFDMSGDIGSAAVKAPSLISFEVTVNGKSSHAGFAPEKGINAIEIMSKAIAQLKQGYLDEETTFNIGTLSGGTARNIVADQCRCTGEIRSFSHSKALEAVEKLKNTFSKAAGDSGASFKAETTVHMKGYNVPENETPAVNFLKACEKIGLNGQLTSTFGGSDNHSFLGHGINGVVLSCGMYDVHSVSEYTSADQLVLGAALAAELILGNH